MTTQHFSAMASATARAMAAVRTEHCPAPDYRPAAPVRASMPCTKCGGVLKFNVSADGRTSGRCSSAGCITWRDL